MGEATERKKEKYAEQVEECHRWGWCTWCLPIEVRGRGFAGKSVCLQPPVHHMGTQEKSHQCSFTMPVDQDGQAAGKHFFDAGWKQIIPGRVA